MAQKLTKDQIDDTDSVWPAFAAYDNRGGDVTVTNGTIPCQTEHFDLGGNYNTSTYEFTAPVNGIYHFSWTCYSNNPNTSGATHRISLVCSNGVVMGNGSDKTLSATVQLNAGQTAKLTTGGNFSVAYYASISHNRFSGHLVHKI